MTLHVGDLLYGFCEGYFGRDSYGDKRVEGVGADWVVAREVESEQAVYASVNPPYLEKFKNREFEENP